MSDDVFRFDDGLLVVAGRRYPWAQVSSNDANPGDVEFHERRARVLFENRWGLSIIWSTGSYSANHGTWHGGFVEESPTAELAAYFHSPAGGEDMVDVWAGDDSVEGYIGARHVRDIVIPVMMAWPSDPALVTGWDVTTRWTHGLLDPAAPEVP